MADRRKSSEMDNRATVRKESGPDDGRSFLKTHADLAPNKSSSRTYTGQLIGKSAAVLMNAKADSRGHK